jgi:hypothetical protein
MVHQTNLSIQTLLELPLVVWIENLVQCLYFYFAHSLKMHLEFTKGPTTLLGAACAPLNHRFIPYFWNFFNTIFKKPFKIFKDFLI